MKGVKKYDTAVNNKHRPQGKSVGIYDNRWKTSAQQQAYFTHTEHRSLGNLCASCMRTATLSTLTNTTYLNQVMKL